MIAEKSSSDTKIKVKKKLMKSPKDKKSNEDELKVVVTASAYFELQTQLKSYTSASMLPVCGDFT